jgi:hypothetical protein
VTTTPDVVSGRAAQRKGRGKRPSASTSGVVFTFSNVHTMSGVVGNL